MGWCEWRGRGATTSSTRQVGLHHPANRCIYMPPPSDMCDMVNGVHQNNLPPSASWDEMQEGENSWLSPFDQTSSQQHLQQMCRQLTKGECGLYSQLRTARFPRVDKKDTALLPNPNMTNEMKSDLCDERKRSSCLWRLPRRLIFHGSDMFSSMNFGDTRSS